MKKLIILLIAVVSFIGTAAYAENTDTINAECTKDNNIVELSIMINDITDVCGCSFNVVYDNNVLSFQKYETGELFENSSVMVNEKYLDDTIRLVSAGTEEFTQTGSLLKAVFSLKDTTAQNTTILIEEIKLSDGDGNKKLVEDIACDLQISEETSQTSGHRKGGIFNTNIATATTDNNLIVGHLANFKDVLTSDWFYSYVSYVYENKWMQGVTNTEFAPNNNVTRAMFVTVLYRIAGEPEFINDSAFSDVEKDSYYEKAVLWANGQGVVKGISDVEFAPNLNITREQLATILYRYVGNTVNAENNALKNFTDSNEASEYAIEALNWAVENNVISGYDDNSIQPKNNATRAEMAAIMMRVEPLIK